MQPDLGISAVLERMGCAVRQARQDTTVVAPIDGLQPIDIDLSGHPTARSRWRWPRCSPMVEPAPRPRFAPPQGVGPAGGMATEITRLGAGARIEDDVLQITPGALHRPRPYLR